MADQCVTLRLPFEREPEGYDHPLDPIYEVEDAVEAALLQAGVEFDLDGHEIPIGGGDAVICLYGPDADAIAAVARPAAEAVWRFSPFAVVKRYGAPGAQEVTV